MGLMIYEKKTLYETEQALALALVLSYSLEKEVEIVAYLRSFAFVSMGAYMP